MTQLAEILLPQAVERRTVHFRGSADKIVDLRLERSAGVVVPGVVRDVPIFHEDFFDIPVIDFAAQPIAPLEHEDPLARWGEVARQRAAAGAAADDDHVIVFRHRILPPDTASHAFAATAPLTLHLGSTAGARTAARAVHR